MSLQLKKFMFSRQRSREGHFGVKLSKLSSEISFISGLVVAVFFTPTIIIGSLLSKEILVIMANICLGMGYSINFFYRFYSKDISISELLITLVAIGFFLANAYFLLPSLTTLTLINALSIANYAATTINSFFLIRHIIVPPCQYLIEKLVCWLGFEIEGRYFSVTPLSLPSDRSVIDLLLGNTYDHHSRSSQYNPDQLKPWNNLLFKLAHYIDKHNKKFLGYVTHQSDILALEKQIEELTLRGNTDPSYKFIRRKIAFKTTKLEALKEAIKEIDAIESKQITPDHLSFFKNSNAKDLAGPMSLLEERQWLESEIKRQNEKLDSLRSCLPAGR